MKISNTGAYASAAIGATVLSGVGALSFLLCAIKDHQEREACSNKVLPTMVLLPVAGAIIGYNVGKITGVVIGRIGNCLQGH